MAKCLIHLNTRDEHKVEKWCRMLSNDWNAVQMTMPTLCYNFPIHFPITYNTPVALLSTTLKFDFCFAASLLVAAYTVLWPK